MKRLLVFTTAIATAIAVTQRPRHAADATGDPSSAGNVTVIHLPQTEPNCSHDVHISQHESVDIGHERSSTKPKTHVADREDEGHSIRHTARKTVPHIGNTTKRNDNHQRPRVLRKRHRRYKRPIIRKTSLSWATDSVVQTNNSPFQSSSPQFVTSYRNIYKSPPENGNVADFSDVQQSSSSTQDGQHRYVQQLHRAESRNDNVSEANYIDTSSQKSNTGAVNDEIATYTLPGSKNVPEESVSQKVRNQKCRQPVYANDRQRQPLTDGVLKQNEKLTDKNHNVFHTRKSSEQNKSVLTNRSLYNSYIHPVSHELGDGVSAVSVINHQSPGRSLHTGDTRKPRVMNETHHLAPSLETERKSASYAYQELHSGSGINLKSKKMLFEPVVAKTVPPQLARHTDNVGLEEENHTEGSALPKRLPHYSREPPFQQFPEQPKGATNPLEAKGQEANHLKHKLRHERRRRILGRHQTNTSKGLNLSSEQRNDSHSLNVSHPTYNIYNFYGPVIITGGALFPGGSNDTSPSSYESGALTNGSYNPSNVLYIADKEAVSTQPSNVAKNFNYSSLAYNGMTMIFLPTRLANRLLLQSYDHGNDGSLLTAGRSRGFSINSARTFNQPTTSSHYDNPSLHTGDEISPPSPWPEDPHQGTAAHNNGVFEHNNGTLNVSAHMGNDPSISGAGTMGFSGKESDNAPGKAYNASPDSNVLHTEASLPPYTGPAGRESQIPYSVSSTERSMNHGSPLTGYGNSIVNTNVNAGMESSDNKDQIKINFDEPSTPEIGTGVGASVAGSVPNQGSHIGSVPGDTSFTGYDNSIGSPNTNSGMWSSDDRNKIIMNFDGPSTPEIGTGVGASVAGSLPNQGTNSGSLAGDTSFTAPGTQQERGWKIRGRIGFEWNPELSGITDSRMLTTPPENAWNDPWGNYGTSYGPTTGAQIYGWNGPPQPYWQDYNAHYPFRNQVYGGYSATGGFVPPPYASHGGSAGRAGSMWIEGDIWRDYTHGGPDYTTSQDGQPTTYYGPGASPVFGEGVINYSPTKPRSGRPLSHTGASLVGGVPIGAARRTPSGRYAGRRPTHSNQYYGPRPQGGSYNPNLLHSLG
ncbi:uncharacterized protein LOC126284418 isoform X2 [Schistocerca gregaria]|uniref:uncharacterized protein LOC126284418 isoform X2 n=1 Tax=Schistocerca gregaria TaxID=7010 RepID=UPI00211E55DC|nr:uncharacterized protein LOC126284418 isoform X2 [Schistocerca gregaria]